MAHIPQENSVILSELTPADMSNWSLNSDTCIIDTYIDTYIDTHIRYSHYITYMCIGR